MFRVPTITALESGSKQVVWTGNPERSYRVELKDSLANTNWLALAGTPHGMEPRHLSPMRAPRVRRNDIIVSRGCLEWR